MRFTIEIPDELFRTAPAAEPAAAVPAAPMPGATGIALDGGAAPGSTGVPASDLGQMVAAASAGAADSTGAGVGPVAAQEVFDGGPAPSQG